MKYLPAIASDRENYRHAGNLANLHISIMPIFCMPLALLLISTTIQLKARVTNPVKPASCSVQLISCYQEKTIIHLISFSSKTDNSPPPPSPSPDSVFASIKQAHLPCWPAHIRFSHGRQATLFSQYTTQERGRWGRGQLHPLQWGTSSRPQATGKSYVASRGEERFVTGM